MQSTRGFATGRSPSPVSGLHHPLRPIRGGGAQAIELGATNHATNNPFAVLRSKVFRGDLCHAGGSYRTMNTRIHAYLDVRSGRHICAFTSNC